LTLKRLPEADHFFNGQIVALRQSILNEFLL
jgi:alpha/beta superfamily hydrolase